MSDTLPMIDILSDAAKQASEVVRKHFRSGLTAEYKTSNQDLVTKADVESQTIIQTAIKKRLIEQGVPEDEIGFIGEESGLDVSGKYLFAIDPIDGTTNYASGIEYFVISIGCFIDGELSYGILYEPMTDAMYFSTKGDGAFKKRGGETVRLAIEYKELEASMVATYIHTSEELRAKEFHFMMSIFPFVRGARLMGAGALDLGRVADNVFQICLFEKSNIWDIAAATLILREAGGVIVESSGKEIQFDLSNSAKIYPILACHPKHLERILTFVG